jgi:hypothetical protein
MDNNLIMSKKIQLSVPTPCYENWDAMTPAEKGRFCSSCQKQVMDFSNMADSQVAAFFRKKTTGSVCGRFLTEQLNRPMDIPKKRIPWIKYFFQFTLPLFITSLRAGAQQKPELATTQSEAKDKCFSDSILGDTTIVVKPLDSIPVIYPDYKDDTTAAIIDTDIRGIVFEMPDWADCTPSKINILNGKVEDPYSEFVGMTTWGFVVPERLEISDMEPHIEFKEDGSIRVYPNPLSGGSAVNIECKNLEEDFYYLQILTQTGQPVYQKEIWIDKDAAVLNLPLPKITAGMYFMVLTSRQKKKKFTEKIIIQ